MRVEHACGRARDQDAIHDTIAAPQSAGLQERLDDVSTASAAASLSARSEERGVASIGDAPAFASTGASVSPWRDRSNPHPISLFEKNNGTTTTSSGPPPTA